MSVRRASTALLAQRSVHIRIVPRPANIGESREIFRILQRFGEMTMYKHLKYEYHNPADNIALAIYREADSAQQAIRNSPLRFSIDILTKENKTDLQELEEVQEEDAAIPQPPSKDGIDEMLRPSALTNPNSAATATDDPFAAPARFKNPLIPTPTSPPPMPFAPNPSASSHTSYKKYFQVTIDRSRVIHQDFVERQPLWKQFNPMKSMAQTVLAKTVPHIGLSDVGKRPPDAHRTPNKVLKQMSDYIDKRMPSLVEMWGEGGRGKTEGDRLP
ncbi:hypothetical protein K458DRAFT_318805 [Lentithecium fluviatile CBS 122367]|uniref:Uncharacterized protein n=1 Tax=Lentithecium fluviatile CBS 122367 TaxID=1168545 RepID=A0A6G1IIP7_9PLEO|nr:hypothetical protein K458DRAFT_318805 [Lentithecium fluviatile CBS 122367]